MHRLVFWEKNASIRDVGNKTVPFLEFVLGICL